MANDTYSLGLVKRLQARTKYVDDCWIYIGAPSREKSYDAPRIYDKYTGRQHPVARIVYKYLVKPIPKGLMVLHRCDNARCWNPKHLFLGTKQDNSRDMVLKERNYAPIGEKNNRSKLKLSQVIDIKTKLARGVGTTKLARELSINRKTIDSIKHGYSWSHVIIQNPSSGVV